MVAEHWQPTSQPTLTIIIFALVWICVGRLMEIKALCVLFVLHPHVHRITTCVIYNSLQKTGREMGREMGPAGVETPF